MKFIMKANHIDMIKWFGADRMHKAPEQQAIPMPLKFDVPGLPQSYFDKEIGCEDEEKPPITRVKLTRSLEVCFEY